MALIPILCCGAAWRVARSIENDILMYSVMFSIGKWTKFGRNDEKGCFYPGGQ